MSIPRKTTMSMIYNGVEAWNDIAPYLENFTYTDSVDDSDSISITLSDRDLRWFQDWAPIKGDRIEPTIILENWGAETEQLPFVCGSFLVDDFSFSAPPVQCCINGVSAPVHTDFKEASNTKTWEAANVRLIAAEIAGKYGMELNYESVKDIEVAKMEQSGQTDSNFLKKLCDKYGLGMKIFYNRIIIWDFKNYFARDSTLTITPEMTGKWSYSSTIQGTYTGAKVSYSSPKKKKSIEITVGREGRIYKTSQKADSEAEAILIGESAITNANRKANTMKITLIPGVFIYSTNTVQISGFGVADGKYFVEKVTHTKSTKSYDMQVGLSRISEDTTVNL